MDEQPHEQAIMLAVAGQVTTVRRVGHVYHIGGKGVTVEAFTDPRDERFGCWFVCSIHGQQKAHQCGHIGLVWRAFDNGRMARVFEKREQPAR